MTTPTTTPCTLVISAKSRGKLVINQTWDLSHLSAGAREIAIPEITKTFTEYLLREQIIRTDDAKFKEGTEVWGRVFTDGREIVARDLDLSGFTKFLVKLPS